MHKKLNLFIEYDILLVSFDFLSGSYKNYNLSIYSYLNCFSEYSYILVVCDSFGALFNYKDFDSFHDLKEYVLKSYDFDISFIKF